MHYICLKILIFAMKKSYFLGDFPRTKLITSCVSNQEITAYL